MAPRNLILSRLIGTLQAFFRSEGCFVGQEISTPSNPSSGYRKLYPKSDGSWYLLNSTGSETEIVGASGDGVIPLGAIIAHFAGSGLTGMPSITSVRAAGFATCDGTTPASQGISSPTITAATPDINGDSAFIRANDAASATLQSHALETHDHSKNFTVDYDYSTNFSGGVVATASTSSGTPSGASTGSVTRPDYCTVVWFMRVK